MKILHLADLHYGNTIDSLEETDRCANYILDVVERDVPDVIVLAGDTCDEYQGRIRIDSEAARRVIAFVERAANICPVIIIRGTLSHDRDTPYLFRHLSARFPIHVSTEIEQVMLCRLPDGSGASFVKFTGYRNNYEVALFTCLPSVDKSYLMATMDASIHGANAHARGLLFDLCSGLGLVNGAVTDVPKIAIAHCMVTGCSFGGQMAVGDDLEYSTNDLSQLDVGYVAMGHIHAQQSFTLANGAKAFFSGSVGRLSFGEKEDKGALLVEFDAGCNVSHISNIPTPARRFVFSELPEWSSANNVMNEAICLARDCANAFVRFRYVVPEEERYSVSRSDIEALFTQGGAKTVKVEVQILPKVRQRAAGISRVTSLQEKLLKWGEATGEVIPESVMALAGRIEGMSTEELLASALADRAVLPFMQTPDDGMRGPDYQAAAAIDRDLHIIEQGGLF